MAIFEPPEMKFYPGIELPGISIEDPCHLSETARIAVVKGGSITIGRSFGIGEYSMVQTYGGEIKIGNSVSVQAGCMLYGHGGLTIGHRVSIATQTVIVPSNHNFDSMDIPIRLQGDSGKGITIGNDVWIGAGCKILDGVTIGSNSVIGAGSVVTRSIPERSIVAGVPARVIKKRISDDSKDSKRGIVKGKTPLVIIEVTHSYGEIDWVLPVLILFKQKNPEYEIATLFGCREIFRPFSMNKFLFRQFLKISSIDTIPEGIDSVFKERFFSDQVKIILKENSGNNSTLFKKYPDALVVNFPESNRIHSSKSCGKVQTEKISKASEKYDLFLLSSQKDVTFWSNGAESEKIKAFGYPRFDSWWVKKLMEDFEFLKSDENRYAKEAKIVFTYISGEPRSEFLTLQDYKAQVHSMLDVIGGYKNAMLFIKAHPKQSTEELIHILKPTKKIRWIISGLHLMQLAHISDVVISGGSSGVLDALAVGKPAIEFFQSGQTGSGNKKKEEGAGTRIYSELGLAAPARTKKELQKLIKSALTNPKAGTWKTQQTVFKSVCKFTDSASEDIADCLAKMIK